MYGQSRLEAFYAEVTRGGAQYKHEKQATKYRNDDERIRLSRRLSADFTDFTSTRVTKAHPQHDRDFLLLA